LSSLYQQCLRHRWFGISIVSDTTDAVLHDTVPAFAPTPLIWHQQCLRRYRRCCISGVSDTADLGLFEKQIKVHLRGSYEADS
jgi:hypothetical protein